jgi:hypothetical protein
MKTREHRTIVAELRMNFGVRERPRLTSQGACPSVNS